MPSDSRTPAADDMTEMSFGIHKGKSLQDVPASYLHWLWSSGFRELSRAVAGCPPGMDGERLKIANYIYNNLHRLKQEYKDGIWT